MKRSFEAQIEKGKRMFFIYSSPLPFPLNFALHTRIVTVKPNGDITRYEIHMFKNPQKELGYMYINNQGPDIGMEKFAWNKHEKHKSKLLFKLSGENGDLANKIVNFVEDNAEQYKQKGVYIHIPGPNCNSFTQRVLNHFPEIKFKLPGNALGKDFHRICHILGIGV